jgi:hypothetical protein
VGAKEGEGVKVSTRRKGDPSVVWTLILRAETAAEAIVLAGVADLAMEGKLIHYDCGELLDAACRLAYLWEECADGPLPRGLHCVDFINLIEARDKAGLI